MSGYHEPSEIERIMDVLKSADEGQLLEIDKLLQDTLGHMAWVPTYGPQLDAFRHPADELFYGGSAGGGKSSLGIGLSLTQHRRSLLLRRQRNDAEELAEQMLELLGTRSGYNGQKLWLRHGGRFIHFSGCKDEADKQSFKGKPYDLYVFDEITDFLQSQYEFIIGWNRSTVPGQRCRIVCTGNPPTEAAGVWVIQRWAPWLDPRHPKPAKSGEMRWYIRDFDGRDTPVDGLGEYDDGSGRMVLASSRTFIRAKLEDNPDLTQSDDYKRTLDKLPKELRDAYRDGRFDASIKDNPHQMIPTDWVRAAMDRWRPEPPRGIPMCAIGVDGARTHDESVLAPRWDGYYGKLIVNPGKATPSGRELAGLIVANRRDDAMVNIDVLESTGAQAYAHLRDQIGTEYCFAYRGLDEATERTSDKQVGFKNRRAAAYWLLREALDPSQDGGSPIALPPDPELTADLTVLTFEVTPQGIKALSKEDVVEKLGRSPDKGDAVVMSWYKGPRAMTHMQLWLPDERVDPRIAGRRGKRPGYNRGPRRR